MRDELWIFAYGSLIWRPAFAHLERRVAWVEGWARRFWQGSTDHRGLPHAPGRVVTLVRDPDARCGGVAYRVAPDAREGVLAALDRRESGGFERIALELEAGGGAPLPGVGYVALPGNPNYLGPAAPATIAAQIRRARGPSGSNLEYLVRLAEELRALGAPDAHVEELLEHLSAD